MRRWLRLWVGLFAITAFASGALAEDIKLQATLIWGTNVKDPNLKPVSPALAKKFKNFKWTQYYEIARTNVSVSNAESRVRMSKECVLVVKLLGNGQLEVTLIGKGRTVGTIQKDLHKGGCLVTGGEATNSTGWFILMKRTE